MEFDSEDDLKLLQPAGKTYLGPRGLMGRPSKLKRGTISDIVPLSVRG
jgi:hypothetical protein